MNICHTLLLHFIKRYLCICIKHDFVHVLFSGGPRWFLSILIKDRPPWTANVIVGPPWPKFLPCGSTSGFKIFDWIWVLGSKSLQHYGIHECHMLHHTRTDEGVVCTVHFTPFFVPPLITLLTWSQSGQSTKTTLSRWQFWFEASYDFVCSRLW